MNYGQAIKKPIEIDWFEWKGDDFYLEQWVKSFNQKYLDNFISTTTDNILNLYVKTLEGSPYAVPVGYIIIRGVEGEYYPCDTDIFNKTYQKQ